MPRPQPGLTSPRPAYSPIPALSRSPVLSPVLGDGALDPYASWPLFMDFANNRYRLGVGAGRTSNWLTLPGASYTRTGEQLCYNAALGRWEVYAASTPPVMAGGGMQVDEGTTNKCTNYNAAPPVLVSMMGSAAFNAAAAAATGMSATGGDAGSLWGVVDDTSELRNSGLGPLLDAGKLNGRVYKIDNTAGGAIAAIGPNGFAGNTNPHSMSAFVRGSGKGQVRSSGSPITATDLTRQYVRRSITQTPIDTANRNLIFTVDPGAVGYIILNQLEEKPYATNPVIVAGASASRGNAQPVVTGLSSILTPPFTLVAVANLSAIDGVDRYFVSVNDATANNDATLRRSTTNLLRAGVTAGGAGIGVNLGTAITGPRLAKAAVRIRSSEWLPAANGVLSSTQSASAPTGLSQIFLGGSRLGSLLVNSPLLFAGIAPDLTDAQLQALTASYGLTLGFS